MRRMAEKELYYWIKEREGKAIIVEEDDYSCLSNVKILKENIDNRVVDIKRDSEKIYIKLDDNSFIKVHLEEVNIC